MTPMFVGVSSTMRISFCVSGETDIVTPGCATNVRKYPKEIRALRRTRNYRLGLPGGQAPPRSELLRAADELLEQSLTRLRHRTPGVSSSAQAVRPPPPDRDYHRW